MNRPNYELHENQYRFLRENGYGGWGAESFDTRVKSWGATVNALLQSELFPGKNSKILELGSGAGDSLLPFAEAGYQVAGLEISPTAVSWAQEKFSKVGLNGHFSVANITEKFQFADSSFDVLIDAACLHCIIGDDRMNVLNEVSRVLKSGGFLLISHMVNDPRELDQSTRFNVTERTQEVNGIPYRAMPTEEQLLSELNNAGFKMIKKEIRRNTWWDHAELWCVKG